MSEPFPPPPPTSPPPSAQPFLPMVLGPLGGTALPGPAEAWRARPYSQMLRGPNHAWWRPLVSTLVVGLWLIGLVVAFGVLLAAAMATSGVLGPDDAPSRAQLDEWGASPSGLLLINLSLALLIPIAQSAVWAGHGWRPRWVASVTGGVRWVWLVRCYLASLVVLVVVNGVLVAIDGGLGEIAAGTSGRFVRPGDPADYAAAGGRRGVPVPRLDDPGDRGAVRQSRRRCRGGRGRIVTGVRSRAWATGPLALRRPAGIRARRLVVGLAHRGPGGIDSAARCQQPAGSGARGPDRSRRAR